MDNPKKLKSYYLQPEKGYITLLSTLFLVTIGGVVAGSLILLGLGFSRTSLALDQSNQAKALANACAEEALQQIRSLTSFTGTGSLTLGQGSCSYSVTSGGGENRTITASGSVGTIVRKIAITVTAITPNITVASWQEVADF